MAVESEDLDFMYVPEVDLIECPVISLCRLPKHAFLCKTPDCRELCSEYLTKVKNL
ncbi:MAG: hypothetical protein KGD65_03215 [Candidatus Lokiarchaeota archaeon]|nr:hypothetical protein [Candidatus Lokiarchaeota archaeon]